MPSLSRLSPRYMTKGSSPRYSSAIRTAWARPERRRLAQVGHAQAEARAVADRGLDFGVGVADDDADLVDAGLAQGLEAVEEDGFVGDGHELLGRGVGDGPQPGAGAAAEDEPLHATPPPARRA